MSQSCEAPPPPPSASVQVVCANALDYLRGIDACRFHAVVTDPPYGLSEPLAGEDVAAVLAQWIAEGEHTHTKGRKKPAKPGGTDATSRLAGGGFMGAQWDSFVPGPRVWAEVLRVTRPGGFLLAFAGSRTAGWMEISLMLAGWEVLDSIHWLYAEGFPKGGNVGKRTDAAEGTIWDDWSTTLKPAHEPIIVARRPLAERSVAANLLKWRTGALNIGACRVGTEERFNPSAANRGATATSIMGSMGDNGSDAGGGRACVGRWPANLMLTHAETCGDECVEGCPVRLLDEQGGERKSGSRAAGVRKGLGYHGAEGDGGPAIVASSGGASRFFFSAKASPSDRSEGLPDGAKCDHPTVKPVPLVRELVRLVCTPGANGEPPGEVLDPFGGSGTTGVALALEGLRGLVVECDPHYACNLAAVRVNRALALATRGECPKHWRRRGG